MYSPVKTINEQRERASVWTETDVYCTCCSEPEEDMTVLLLKLLYVSSLFLHPWGVALLPGAEDFDGMV